MRLFALTFLVNTCTSAHVSSVANVHALRWNIAKTWPNLRWRQQE